MSSARTAKKTNNARQNNPSRIFCPIRRPDCLGGASLIVVVNRLYNSGLEKEEKSNAQGSID
jgi:hypothetical protein